MLNCIRWFLLSLSIVCIAEQITYLSMERPNLTYYNPKYLDNVSLSSRRFGRHNPIYYFNIRGTVLDYAGNNVTVLYSFYEFLSNTYKRGFIELRYRLCDLIEKDDIMGVLIRSKIDDSLHCPFPPGYYELLNITVPPTKVPKNFPFRKGRVYCNVTVTYSDEPIARAYFDIELKQMKANKSTPDLFM